ncbi:GNAT family N-acetyltransferase [Collimonas silvisoli]|uniref:GNAT family N-acetyltransferase n=1 Tax=Collimonas silvisoli TaxID=2825884 RepID=UPI001B8BABA4|nr:N-acetyltransferase [Collimonas silvisoli]
MTVLMLRPPVAADYTAIAAWIPDALACARWAGPQLEYPFDAGELPQLLQVKRGASYVLCKSQADRFGFGQYRLRQPGVVHLCRIIVAPEARGNGLGKVLCRLLIDEARSATAAQAVTLRVYRDNAAAYAIYSGLGFVPVEAESDAEVLMMKMTLKSPF